MRSSRRDAYAGAQVSAPLSGQGRSVCVGNLPVERTPLYVFERGHLLIELGRYEEAVEASASAVELLADREGEIESYLAACHLHGIALKLAGRWEEARVVLEAAYMKSFSGVKELAQLRLARGLASVNFHLDDLPRAKELGEKVLQGHMELLGAEHRETGEAMVNQGSTLRRQGELGRARAHAWPQVSAATKETCYYSASGLRLRGRRWAPGTTGALLLSGFFGLR